MFTILQRRRSNHLCYKGPLTDCPVLMRNGTLLWWVSLKCCRTPSRVSGTCLANHSRCSIWYIHINNATLHPRKLEFTPPPETENHGGFPVTLKDFKNLLYPKMHIPKLFNGCVGDFPNEVLSRCVWCSISVLERWHRIWDVLGSIVDHPNLHFPVFLKSHQG